MNEYMDKLLDAINRKLLSNLDKAGLCRGCGGPTHEGDHKRCMLARATEPVDGSET